MDERDDSPLIPEVKSRMNKNGKLNEKFTRKQE